MLDKGLVIAGDIKINLANVELLTIQVRLLICSIDKAEQIGLNWWRRDPHLTIQSGATPEIEARLDADRGAVDAPRAVVGRSARAVEVAEAIITARELQAGRHSSTEVRTTMAVERTPSGSSLIDVLDRVLDKGIVIDAWVRVSLVGIDLVTVEARIVVASIDTYLKYSEAVGITSPVSRPREIGAGDEFERVQRENVELRRQLEERRTQ